MGGKFMKANTKIYWVVYLFLAAILIGAVTCNYNTNSLIQNDVDTSLVSLRCDGPDGVMLQ